jgi:hypothetical protein
MYHALEIIITDFNIMCIKILLHNISSWAMWNSLGWSGGMGMKVKNAILTVQQKEQYT